eukprot:GHVL01022975.1.p1 GENE.GHVL01022975.1~~GHVL01022975.1.p1  ORF type:complete len:165 (+),score=31.47 GHVL01022975.1:28-522(+)
MANELPTDASSAITLIKQAVMSKDAKVVESVLTIKNDSVIEATIDGVTPTVAAQLLSLISDLMLEHGARAAQSCPWVRQILKSHGLHICSTVESRAALEPLRDSINMRCQCLPSLIRLQGKLEAVLALSDKKNGHDRTIGDAALVEYVEGDEEIEKKIKKPGIK